MAMVGVVNCSLQADSRPKSTGLVWELAPSGAEPHSSDEPSELSMWLSHDDRTINIVLGIIIIIIINIICVINLNPVALAVLEISGSVY